VRDLLPASIAHKIPLLDDCRDHQWFNDLALYRLWSPDDDKWVTDMVHKWGPQDDCIYCKGVRENPGYSDRPH